MRTYCTAQEVLVNITAQGVLVNILWRSKLEGNIKIECIYICVTDPLYHTTRN